MTFPLSFNGKPRFDSKTLPSQTILLNHNSCLYASEKTKERERERKKSEAKVEIKLHPHKESTSKMVKRFWSCLEDWCKWGGGYISTHSWTERQSYPRLRSRQGIRLPYGICNGIQCLSPLGFEFEFQIHLSSAATKGHYHPTVAWEVIWSK